MTDWLTLQFFPLIFEAEYGQTGKCVSWLDFFRKRVNIQEYKLKRKKTTKEGNLVRETQVLTTQELADYMKLNEKTVLKMAQKGKLPGVKIGSQWRFHMGAIDQYLQKDVIREGEDRAHSILTWMDYSIPLSRLFDKTLIKLDLKAENMDQALNEMVDVADAAGIIGDKGRLLEEMKTREKMLSTAVGNGIAIPHPRKPDSSLFRKPNILMARSQNGIDFHSPDGKNVHLFFMACAPNTTDHLRLIAKISELLQSDGVIDKFMKASGGDEIIKVLLEMERKNLFPWEEVE